MNAAKYIGSSARLLLSSGPMSSEGSRDAVSLEQSIRDRTARVAVIGLGYVGLPLVAGFADGGFRVLGFDVDTEKVTALESGRSYIAHFPSSKVEDLKNRGRFEATSDFSRLSEADAVVICVPTPLDAHRQPDLSYIEATAEQIGKAARPGQLVVLESTTYPGTTEEIVQPRLEARGLVLDRDFFLAFSPEREDPNNPSFTLRTIPKVIGGVTKRSGELAEALYGAVVDRVVLVESARVAEAAKLVENVFRCVNIALVNELKLAFDKMGIDVWQVLDAASTKPFGFMRFEPGPGLGGHCIPIDPFYLTWKAREFGVATRFIELAGEINTAMPDWVVGKLAAALNDAGKPLRGSKILVVGVAYKKNVDDTRESPALEILEKLIARGAYVSYHDPHVPRLPKTRRHAIVADSIELTAEAVAETDAVVIVTDHDAVDWERIARNAPLVVDTRNCLRRRSLSFRGISA
jgi:UDP-N-acetyl-D-glucosamine dehydrogenase